MMFIMGMLMGSGLVLAWQELQFQIYLRKEDKIRKAQNEAIALLDPAIWETPLLDEEEDDTCGCHFSWDDHEKWMIKGCTPVNSTPDTKWWV